MNIYTVRNLLLLIFFLSFSRAFCQQEQIRDFSFRSDNVIRSEQEASALLKNNYPALNRENADIRLQTYRESPQANYYTFVQTFTGIEVQPSQIKISTNKKGKILFIAGHYFDMQNWQSSDFHIQEVELPELLRSQYHFTKKENKPVICADENNEPALYYLFEEDFETDRSKVSLLISEDGELIYTDDHKVYFSAIDTVVYGFAFKPDPLTSAGVTYGGDYDDNNDEDNDALHAQLMEVTVRATYEDGYFYLRTDSLKLKDLGAPGDAVVIETHDDFHYSRDNNNFEDVNTIYHIENFQDYLESIGYLSLYNFYIEIDPHGAGGADQSYFVGGAIPSIQFGEGGVDDAEDADVLIHEYTHGLSYHAAPNTNDGNERRAADEGYGDYFAVSYSRMYSDYNWENVFSWDGHNEFWSGRNANTNKHYPENVSADFYGTSEIWSGALMDIYDAIGKENCDKIVCEALYGSFEDMSLHDAAMLILDAETLLFGDMYYDVVYDMLDARGLINPVGVNNTTVPNNIVFKNTNGFCLNHEPLTIELPNFEKYELKIFSVEGKLIYRESGVNQKLELDPSMIHNSVFVVSVSTGENISAITLVKPD